MLIDKKGRIFGKISVIDLFVILVLTFILLFGIFRIGNSNAIGVREPMSNIRMTFFLESVEDFTANTINIGDIVIDDETNVYLGTIVELEVGESIDFMPNADGIMVTTSKEGYSSVLFTTEFTAHKFQEGVLASGNTYFVGQLFTIRAGNSRLFLRISDIEIY